MLKHWLMFHILRDKFGAQSGRSVGLSICLTLYGNVARIFAHRVWGADLHLVAQSPLHTRRTQVWSTARITEATSRELRETAEHDVA